MLWVSLEAPHGGKREKQTNKQKTNNKKKTRKTYKTIIPDKMLFFFTKNVYVFSHFSMKTYVVVLIRSI